jgi:small subunit ribosomal protein S6
MPTKTIQKEYEILYIIKPHLADENYTQHCEKFEKMVNENEGEIDFVKPLGIRDLATPIKKINQGYYIQSQFKATGKTLDKIQNKFAVDESIIRHLIVTMDSIQAKTDKTEQTEEGE